MLNALLASTSSVNWFLKRCKNKTKIRTCILKIAPDSGDVPPSLTNLEDVNVVEGSPVQFRTLVSGTPLPTIQWMREGQIIPPSSDFQVFKTFYPLLRRMEFDFCFWFTFQIYSD